MGTGATLPLKRDMKRISMAIQGAGPGASSLASGPSGTEVKKFSNGSSRKSVTVVGSGIGGLVSAGLLAQAGFDVEILEKNSASMVGGRVNAATIKGIRFDLGPSLLLLPEVYRRTFKALGVDLDQHIELRRVKPTYFAYFDDGDHIVLDSRLPEFKERLEEFEEGAYTKFEEYIKSAETNLEGGWPNFIEESFTPNVLPKFLANAVQWRNFPLRSHYDSLSDYFKSEKLRALFSFQDLYVGLSPYSAPSVFSLLTAIELSDGVYYPLGGFAKVAELLERRCKELGVRFRYGTEVEKMLIENKAVIGVGLKGGGEVRSDMVIANPDLPYVEETLIPEDVRRETSSLEYSTPTVSLYFALDKEMSALNHHNIMLSTDYKESWDSILADGRMPRGSFNFYVHAPSRTDPSVVAGRPSGGDSIMCLVPTPPLPVGLSQKETRAVSDAWTKIARDGVISRFKELPGMEDFESHIIGEMIRTPADWRSIYNLNRGCVFGTSCKLTQLSVLRSSPKHPNLENLWFVGASTRPGNGVPLVATGARLLAERIIQEVPLERV